MQAGPSALTTCSHTPIKSLTSVSSISAFSTISTACSADESNEQPILQSTDCSLLNETDSESPSIPAANFTDSIPSSPSSSSSSDSQTSSHLDFSSLDSSSFSPPPFTPPDQSPPPFSPPNSPQPQANPKPPSLNAIINPENPSSSPDDSNLFKPLYPGAEISYCAAMCAIMQFCTANHLSYAAIAQLLQLLILLCPANNTIPTSIYRLKKFFKRFSSQNTITTACGECQKLKESCRCSPTKQKLGKLVNVSLVKPLRTIVSSRLLVI